MSQEPPKNFLPIDPSRDRLYTEQPLDPQLYREMRLPNPLDPIGSIETEGRALRTLAKGRMPKWVVFTGWATIGLGSFASLGMIIRAIMPEIIRAIVTNHLSNLILAILSITPALVTTILMLMILYRATFRSR
ncbi:hypothetical protein ACN4EG_26515 [Alkalinema pantanalense CENA528]|uniref:hypothetical protein n=1 Tax=Alkalinema pantanalense TaxID=1620705 RepID=UPI003D6EDCC5